MDPASIVGLVAACSSLTKQCASVVEILHGLIETYRYAELAILSIVQECETIQFAWRRIAVWANENLHCVDDFEELGERLQKSIYCGELVMSALEEELVTVISSSSRLKRRVGLLWNNGVFNEHQTRIRGQVQALQLLLQVMSLPRKEQRAEVLSVKEKVFLDSDESALSIIPSDRSTHLSIEGNRLSIVSDTGDVQYIRFSFEDALFTSHVYKRNYRFPVTKSKAQSRELELFEFDLPTHKLTGSDPDETETQTLTGDLNEDAANEPDDIYFQTQMIELHNDLFDGAHSSITTTDPTPNPIQHGISTPLHPTSSQTAIVGLTTATTSPSARELYTPPDPSDVKKSALKRALDKANTAVLLDNAQNFEVATEFYDAACELLGVVIGKSRFEEDRRKLEAIRDTYRCRITELAALMAL